MKKSLYFSKDDSIIDFDDWLDLFGFVGEWNLNQFHVIATEADILELVDSNVDRLIRKYKPVFDGFSCCFSYRETPNAEHRDIWVITYECSDDAPSLFARIKRIDDDIYALRDEIEIKQRELDADLRIMASIFRKFM